MGDSTAGAALSCDLLFQQQGRIGREDGENKSINQSEDIVQSLSVGHFLRNRRRQRRRRPFQQRLHRIADADIQRVGGNRDFPDDSIGLVYIEVKFYASPIELPSHRSSEVSPFAIKPLFAAETFIQALYLLPLYYLRKINLLRLLAVNLLKCSH